MIEYSCPECGHLLRMHNRYSGAKGACKYCNARFTVPEGPILPDLPPGTRGETPRASQAPQESLPPSYVDLVESALNFDDTGSGFTRLPPRATTRTPVQPGADGILGTRIGGAHFSWWLVGLGLMVGVFGFPLGGALASAGLVYYLNFGRDVEDSFVFNKFTAPVWATFAFVSIPLGIAGNILGAASNVTYLDQIDSFVYEMQYAADVYEHLASNPGTEPPPPPNEIPQLIKLPEGAAGHVARAGLNLLLTALSATAGTALSLVSIGIFFAVVVGIMSPFYVVKRGCSSLNDTAGAILYGLFILCSGTLVPFLTGYLLLLLMYWLGRRLFALWGRDPEWGLAWRGFIYTEN